MFVYCLTGDERAQNLPVDLATNPLYDDGGVMYEEIPGSKPLPRQFVEIEDGYVCITSSGKITRDFLFSQQPRLTISDGPVVSLQCLQRVMGNWGACALYTAARVVVWDMLLPWCKI